MAACLKDTKVDSKGFQAGQKLSKNEEHQIKSRL